MAQLFALTCECGGCMVRLDVTGYWPYVPCKCQMCGVVDYVRVDKQAAEGAQDGTQPDTQR